MMISLLHCRYLGAGLFAVQFSGGAEGTFDLNDYLAGRQGPLLLPLRDEGYASRAFIEAGALAWPNGLEIAPQRIYDLAHVVQRAA